MSYSPNNIYVYMAAFNGAQAGILGQSLQSSVDDYADTDAVCGAFAEALDTAWGTGSESDEQNPDLYQITAIEELSKVYWIGRTIGPLPGCQEVASYTGQALTILAIVTSGEVYLTGQDITPPAYPPGPSTPGSFAKRSSATFPLSGAFSVPIPVALAGTPTAHVINGSPTVVFSSDVTVLVGDIFIFGGSYAHIYEVAEGVVGGTTITFNLRLCAINECRHCSLDSWDRLFCCPGNRTFWAFSESWFCN